MSVDIQRMVKVVRIEFEEIENDVSSLERYYEKRFENDEITNYVWRENRALLEKELACVRRLARDLDDFRIPEDTGPEEVLKLLEVFLHKIIEERSYPGVVRMLVDRTMAKVGRYIS